MKGVLHSSMLSSLVLLALSLHAAPPANRAIVWEHYPQIVNSNTITVAFRTEGEAPELMAIVVENSEGFPEWDDDSEDVMAKWRAEFTNRVAQAVTAPKPKHPFENAQWMPFRTNVMVNLGPGDGERSILFSYRYKGQTRADGYTGGGITVRTKTPVIQILNPTNRVTSQPVIQLQGRADCELISVRFDQIDEHGRKRVNNGEGHPGATYTGDPKPNMSLKGFTCFDVELSPGTNTFVLRCTDDAGNSATTNTTVVFRTQDDVTAPTLLVYWPQPLMRIMGGTFTIRGRTDDPTAKLHGINVANEQTNHFEGFAERNGFVWFEDVPLAIGTNALTLTATDVAGNRTSTNLVVYGTGNTVLTVEPIEPKRLWDQFISVKGRVSPANNNVWINGVQARVNPDGSWTAEKVPVKSPSGGTAIFDLTALPIGGPQGATPRPKDLVRAQASLGTNDMVLNATSPACGVFQLHLNDTGGRGFVLFASTNLTEWTPILTNAAPDATFDYTDAETSAHACRFFKIVPLR